jgi:hypothetical protein
MAHGIKFPQKVHRTVLSPYKIKEIYKKQVLIQVESLLAMRTPNFPQIHTYLVNVFKVQRNAYSCSI